jgi:UDP-N-acetylglucosamine 2-epimerase (non-hydrolysing)
VLVVRESTERGEGVDAGTLTLVGTEPDRIVPAAEAVLADPSGLRVDPTDNPYGDGRAADRIAAAFEYLAGVGPVPPRYGPGFSRRDVLEAGGYPFGMFTTPLRERGAQPDRHEELDRWVGR